MPGNVLSILSPLILIYPIKYIYFYPHLIDEEVEAQIG